MKTNIEAKFKLIEILNISPVELSYIKDLTIPENIVSELLNGESGALKVHLENIQNDETLPVDTRLLAACLKNRMKDSVIRIKMDGLDEDEDDETIMAKALIVAQKTIDNKNKLLEDAKKEIAEKDRVITQISISQNTKWVRETAKAISKSNSKILIGERRLYERLRSWGWVCKNSTEATQYAVERGYLEVSEGTKKTARGTFTFRTTRVTGKGEIKIIEKLLKEKDLEKLLEENEKSK